MKLYTEECGDGHPLLLLPGLGYAICLGSDSYRTGRNASAASQSRTEARGGRRSRLGRTRSRSSPMMLPRRSRVEAPTSPTPPTAATPRRLSPSATPNLSMGSCSSARRPADTRSGRRPRRPRRRGWRTRIARRRTSHARRCRSRFAPAGPTSTRTLSRPCSPTDSNTRLRPRRRRAQYEACLEWTVTGDAGGADRGAHARGARRRRPNRPVRERRRSRRDEFPARISSGSRAAAISYSSSRPSASTPSSPGFSPELSPLGRQKHGCGEREHEISQQAAVDP